MLLTIAGSSCSGKTTAMRACGDIDGLVVHDFDEVGVPAGADVAWRQRSLETWIRRALRYQDDGLDVVLAGQSPLGEVLASPSAIALDGIAACLLDVDDDVRRQRLEGRDPGKWDADAQRAFIGWARWHRGHAIDPHHLPEVITTNGYEQMRWARWAGWPSTDHRWAVRVLDTTGQTVAQSAAGIRHWVTDARRDRDSGRLALAGEWASG